MRIGVLGKQYTDGEMIVRQGEPGNCMYIVQQGQVEVFLIRGEKEIPLSVLNVGDTFGEMSLLSRQPRSASVRARGRARVLTVDKRGFLKRVQEDPSLAFRVLRQLSERVRELDEEVARLRP